MRDACVSITIMLSATVLFITWACIVRTLYLIPTEKNKVYIYSVFLGAGVNVIINWALIPRLASVGAAVGTIIAEVTVAVYQTIMVRKELDVSQCMKKSVPFIIFGSIMFLVVKILPFEVGGNIGRLIAKIFIGAMVYLALSAIYFLKTKNKLFYDVIGKLDLIEQNNLRYDMNCILVEDALFNHQYMSCCMQSYYVDCPLYHYITRSDSLTNQSFKEKNWKLLESYRNIIKFCGLQKDKELDVLLNENYLNHEITILKKMKFSKTPVDREKMQWLKEKVKSEIRSIWCAHNISLKRKLMAIYLSF